MPTYRSHSPRPRKALGQHFLRDTGVLADIAAAIEVPREGVIIEVGAGTGALTRVLTSLGHEVVAIEIEPRLVHHLRREFADRANLRIVPGDARSIDFPALAGGFPYAVAGNLPYFAANPIIRHLLESSPPPGCAVVMVQREVAREMCALPGKSSLLSLGVQVYAQPELLFDVPPEAFDPPPAVYSSVVRLRTRAEPLVPRDQIREFFEFASRTFRNPRKQLHNALTRETSLTADEAAMALADCAIDGSRRAETLSIAEWQALIAASRLARAGA